jgi:small-conductance mechanosensitive channel
MIFRTPMSSFAPAGQFLPPQLGQARDGAVHVSLLPGMSAETQLELVISLLLVLALLFGRRLLMVVVRRRTDDPVLRYKWSKGTAYFAFLIGVLLLIQVWFSSMRSLGTFLGLMTAGLAIALKDVVADFAGWLFLLWRRPFELGDRIEIGGFAGDVIDRRLFQFSLMEIGNWVEADQSTGRVIHVPNAMLFTQPLANYTQGFPYLWNELPLMVTFHSDWRKAKEIMERVATEETADVLAETRRPEGWSDHRFLIHFRTLTPMVYTAIGDHGIQLTLRYLTRPRQRRGTTAAIWERVLDALAVAPEIEFAYPTHVVSLESRQGVGSAFPRGPLSREAGLD